MSELVGDRALNTVSARAFGDTDDDRAIAALVGTPLPTSTTGLLEAAFLLVPVLRVRSGTVVSAAAEARLIAILGVLDLRRLNTEGQRARADLEQHRRRAGSSQRSTEAGASVLLAMGLAALGAFVLWLVAFLGTVYVIGALVAVPVLTGALYLVFRWLDAADSEPDRVVVKGLRVDPWLSDALPPVAAAATQLAFVLPQGEVSATRSDYGSMVIVNGPIGESAVIAEARVLRDVADRSPSTGDEALAILTGYLQVDGPDVLRLPIPVAPTPRWGRGGDPWQRLMDGFDVHGPIVVLWQVVGSGLVATLGCDGEPPVAVAFADLGGLIDGCGADTVDSAQAAAELLSSALVNQLVHGDRLIFTRGGSPADREMLVTALRGGDLQATASRSQWSGEC